MKKIRSGGGWPAIAYTLKKAREVGGISKMWRALRSRNACKTCALGMGGQRGGMVNEAGHFPEVCKKSLQAMAADMQGAISPEFWKTYSLQQLRKFTPRQLENCGRLSEPLLLDAGAEHYRPLSWDDALARVAAKLRELNADETFWYFSGRSSNEAGFLLQLFARLYGTNNVNNCSYYCHQASGVGLNSAIGSGTATVVLEDVDKADLVFVIGGNPPSNHPRLMTSLMRLRQRGGKVIVINPLVEAGLVNFRVPSNVRSLLFGTEIANEYIQPHIGGDLALLTGIAKRILELGQHDPQFLEGHCEDFASWQAAIESTLWDEITDKSGVAWEKICRIAELYAEAKSAIFCWTMGVTHHAHGVENVQAIANLALVRGMVGRPGAGLLPIRGHSNVQGIGSVGVTPKLKDAIFERLQSQFGIQLPVTAGKDTLACIEGAKAGTLRLGLCLGGNLFGSNPDADYAAQALQNLDTIVYLSTTLNTGHAHGTAKETIVLPVLARDEEPQPTTQESMFNYVRLSDGGPRRIAGPRSEVEVVASLAAAVLGSDGPIDWMEARDTGKIRGMIARVVPGFEKIGQIDKTRQEFQIGGRTFHEPRFATASGRARLHAHELPALRGEENQLRLMTIRSEGQFNTVVYEEEDIYRDQNQRDVILMHPDDLRRFSLQPGERVTVCGEAGKLGGIMVQPFDRIKAGNAAMYYPEANVLVARRADAQSKTPAFKGVVVTLERRKR